MSFALPGAFRCRLPPRTAARRPRMRVAAAIAALPERQRLAIFLRYYADLDYAAIAASLGIKAGTVAAALHAAHNTLRKTLQEAIR